MSANSCFRKHQFGWVFQMKRFSLSPFSIWKNNNYFLTFFQNKFFYLRFLSPWIFYQYQPDTKHVRLRIEMFLFLRVFQKWLLNTKKTLLSTFCWKLVVGSFSCKMLQLCNIFFRIQYENKKTRNKIRIQAFYFLYVL